MHRPLPLRGVLVEFLPYVTPAINLLGFIIGGIVIAVTMRLNLKYLQEEVKELKGETKELSKAVTALAVQEARLDMLDRRYEELRHGEGFVFPLAAKLRGSA